ncbi:MAG TPA: hypothetical protein ENF93_01660, partial [Ignisphaera sp.]|nr:hypothetical protein [Ignisphaera sp.]
MPSVSIVLGERYVKSSILCVRDTISDIINRISKTNELSELVKVFVSSIQQSLSIRPTSALLVNIFRDSLMYALNLVKQKREFNVIREEIINRLKSLVDIAEESLDRAARIASRRIVNNDKIMTISYSIGVLKALRYALQDGKKFEVFVLESRPGCEGIEFAKELSQMGIPTTIIVDSAARFYMKNITRVLIGAEAVAANGAVVNKVGTSILALAANEARVRVFVIASTQKFSFETIHGELIEIPTLDPKTILPIELQNLHVKAFVPLFDVTPPEYIDAIATE